MASPVSATSPTTALAGASPEDIARFLQRHGVQAPLAAATAVTAAAAASSPTRTGPASPVATATSPVAAAAAAAASIIDPRDLIAWTDVYDSAVVPVEGNPADLWNIDDYADADDATVFDYPAYPLGGGLTRSQHMGFLQTVAFDLARVPFTPARPYLKELPPTGLPLESFDLRVIYDAGRTGFEDNKEFPITPGTVIAGRYKITEYIGSAAFSRAVQAIDLKHNAYVCIKIVRNSKDFFDQALDEIKLLHYINCNGDPDENHVVQLYDFFYFKEHVFLVCELLRDNLYEFGKYNREHEAEPYFTLPRIQKITKQILRALVYVHSLNLLHCDLKPENVLIKSYSRTEIKVIDFGSSCFTTDNLSSYIQSRCYRAPEVIFGCKYDGRIDVWSLGAMLPELATGHVLFHNDTLPQMLGRISALIGPFPTRMVREGRHSCRYITRSGLYYETVAPASADAADAAAKDDGGKHHATSSAVAANDTEEEKLVFYYPKPRRLEELCGHDDADYISFIRAALTLDHTLRPTAAELLLHPFITKVYPGSDVDGGASATATATATSVASASVAASASPVAAAAPSSPTAAPVASSPTAAGATTTASSASASAMASSASRGAQVAAAAGAGAASSGLSPPSARAAHAAAAKSAAAPTAASSKK